MDQLYDREAVVQTASVRQPHPSDFRLKVHPDTLRFQRAELTISERDLTIRQLRERVTELESELAAERGVHVRAVQK